MFLLQCFGFYQLFLLLTVKLVKWCIYVCYVPTKASHSLTYLLRDASVLPGVCCLWSVVRWSWRLLQQLEVVAAVIILGYFNVVDRWRPTTVAAPLRSRPGPTAYRRALRRTTTPPRRAPNRRCLAVWPSWWHPRRSSPTAVPAAAVRPPTTKTRAHQPGLAAARTVPARRCWARAVEVTRCRRPVLTGQLLWRLWAVFWPSINHRPSSVKACWTSRVPVTAPRQVNHSLTFIPVLL